LKISYSSSGSHHPFSFAHIIFNTFFRRKIDHLGAALRVSGKNRNALIDLLKEQDRYFVQERYRVLNRLDADFVESARRISAPLEPKTQVVATSFDDTVEITRGMVRQIASDHSMSPEVFQLCLRLFREREQRINKAYSESNRYFVT
jgi:hypothetical protein